MNVSGDLRNLFEVTARILVRCFVLNFALILLWFFFLLIGSGRWGYEFHSMLFDITQHEFVLINYCGIAFAKLCNIIFFGLPYIAIRLVLRQKVRQEGG
jgi:hypothetical protein